jgi:hypothetical protein
MMTVTIDAGWVGVVRVTYRRQKMRHGKHSHWAWVSVSAVKAEGNPQN